MNAVTHLEKVITGEASAVTHLEKVIAGETSAVTYTEKVITGEAPPITHLQKVIAGEASPVTHLEYVWTGGTPSPTEHEYTGAVPYTFTANGSPLTAWRISGNTVQSTTPTPDNPIMPEGCGERTAQLIDYTQSEQGGIDASGNLVTGDSLYRSTVYTPVNANITTWVRYEDFLLRLYFYKADKTFILRTEITGIKSNHQVQFPQDTAFIKWSVYKSGGVNLSDVHNMYIMLNEGSEPLPYEPFGVKIPISSANTTTPVYLGEVETTRRVKKLVFDGTEEWSFSYGSFRFILNGYLRVRDWIPFCSHYKGIDFVTGGDNLQNGETAFLLTNSGNNYLYVCDTTIPDVSAWKSYLAQQYAAGTPVTVWYVLATPETAVVNEPLMKIGEYADEVSNVATIPTNNGSTTIDVETAVKPSEIYIKYKGV